jgi:zinc protease
VEAARTAENHRAVRRRTRTRGQVIAGLVYERDSITSQATAIGQLETVGLSWKLMDTELPNWKA